MLLSLDQLPPTVGTEFLIEQNGAATGATGPAIVEVGELLTAVSVMAANVVKDIRENIRNLVGGRMSHYEHLIETAVQQALGDLERKAKSRGYDGVLAVKISHPTVVDGGVEVVVYGNGFRLRPRGVNGAAMQGQPVGQMQG
jgi:uncharacterized protein YbjQ (UPF0145 family)